MTTATGPTHGYVPDYPSWSTEIAFYARLHELQTWLECHNLTLDQALDTIRRACSLTPRGARAEDVTRYFLGVHDIPDEDEGFVSGLAGYAIYRGLINRAGGGRYVCDDYDHEPRVIALVSAPISDWPGLRERLARGTRAWVVDGAEEV